MKKASYPPVGFYFRVSFNGGGINSETSFKEVSGINVNIEPEEITEGGLLQFRHRLPSTPKYTNLVLKRGLVTDSNLRKWIEKAVEEFTFTPITVMVSLLNPKGSPLMSWNFYNVWPVKWEVANFDSMNNALTIESIELAFDYFKTKTS